EPEPRAVAHLLRRRRVRQQALEDLARLAMLAQRQVQAAAQQLGVARVRREPALVAIGREADQRLEVVLLVETEQYVAVVQVLHLHGRQAGDRLLLDDRRGRRKWRERSQDEDPAQHAAVTPRL